MCDKPDELLTADQGKGANASSHHSNTYYICHTDINYILNISGKVCDFVAYSKWVFIYMSVRHFWIIYSLKIHFSYSLVYLIFPTGTIQSMDFRFFFLYYCLVKANFKVNISYILCQISILFYNFHTL